MVTYAIRLHCRKHFKITPKVNRVEKQIMKSVPTKILTLAFGIAALVGADCPLHAQTAAPAAAPPVEMITPAQWLKRQPKPIFKPGHTMPRLTYYGTYRGLSPHVIELAENWNYVLETMYLSDETVKRALTDPTSDEARMIALTLSNPKKYPLAVVLNRDEPPNPAPETFSARRRGQAHRG